MRIIAALALGLAATSLAADDLDNLGALSQQQFELFAADMTAVAAYKGLQPAEPYGAIGFDAGLEAAGVRLSNDSVWAQAGADVSTVPLVRLSANKGLPLDFDIGGFVATAPSTGLRVYGAQLRYALVEGGVATPAVGLRAAFTRVDGVEQLDFDTRSLDISISKGFGPLTPYAGYGRVWSSADPDPATGLVAVDTEMNRAFAGLRFSLIALQFSVEAERVGETTGYAARLGFGF